MPAPIVRSAEACSGYVDSCTADPFSPLTAFLLLVINSNHRESLLILSDLLSDAYGTLMRAPSISGTAEEPYTEAVREGRRAILCRLRHGMPGHSCQDRDLRQTRSCACTNCRPPCAGNAERVRSGCRETRTCAAIPGDPGVAERAEGRIVRAHTPCAGAEEGEQRSKMDHVRTCSVSSFSVFSHATLLLCPSYSSITSLGRPANRKSPLPCSHRSRIRNGNTHASPTRRHSSSETRRR